MNVVGTSSWRKLRTIADNPRLTNLNIRSFRIIHYQIVGMVSNMGDVYDALLMREKGPPSFPVAILDDTILRFHHLG